MDRVLEPEPGDRCKAMAVSSDNHSEDFEPFRGYLTFLARLRLGGRLRTRLDPADIVQETLLRAHRAIEEFRGGPEEMKLAWLRQILARTIANALRDQRREKRDIALERSLEAQLEASSQRLGGLLAADQTSPSEKAIRTEETLAMAGALESLADEQREVLILHHWEGCTLESIAERMATNRFAVSRILRRALSELRSRLKSLE